MLCILVQVPGECSLGARKDGQLGRSERGGAKGRGGGQLPQRLRGIFTLHFFLGQGLTHIQLSNMVLINGVLHFVDDLDLRVHHRSQMESAGLQRIMELCRDFGVPTIDKQLKILQTAIDEDEKKLRERLDQEILQDLNKPEDVYNAIRSKTEDTKARNYFLSMMQHLLLIREDGPAMVHYYQLIDSIITDVVLDKKLAGAEQRLGHSVERIIAQFNEADRYQAAEQEAAEARTQLMKLRIEKDALEQEISQGQDGLIGQLKDKVMQLEQKLQVSRETTGRLQGQLEAQKTGYEEQIGQLEAQIMELFRMLKEVGKGMDTILDSGSMDRKTLVANLEKHFQRNQTISILEGRDKRRRKRGPQAAEDESEQSGDEKDATPGKSSLRRKNGSKSSKSRNAQSGRASQFMDADEAAAERQMQQQLAAGAKLVRAHCLEIF
jgi:cytokinesis protein